MKMKGKSALDGYRQQVDGLRDLIRSTNTQRPQVSSSLSQSSSQNTFLRPMTEKADKIVSGKRDRLMKAKALLQRARNNTSDITRRTPPSSQNSPQTLRMADSEERKEEIHPRRLDSSLKP